LDLNTQKEGKGTACLSSVYFSIRGMMHEVVEDRQATFVLFPSKKILLNACTARYPCMYSRMEAHTMVVFRRNWTSCGTRSCFEHRPRGPTLHQPQAWPDRDTANHRHRPLRILRKQTSAFRSFPSLPSPASSFSLNGQIAVTQDCQLANNPATLLHIDRHYRQAMRF